MSERNVAYTGRSERRILALKQLPQVTEVRSYSGGHENGNHDVVSVMMEKMAYAWPTMMADIGKLNGHNVVAADTRTSIMACNGSKHWLESKGKPKSTDEVIKTFLRMSLAAQEAGFGYYQVVSASGLISGDNTIIDQEFCNVVLTKKGIEFIATNAGYDEYTQAFNHFYSTPPYSNHNLSQIDQTHLSGGISLPVLSSMGVVKSVNGVEIGLSRKKTEAIMKAAIMIVAVGFSPRILKILDPDAMTHILAWDWLNQVTKKVI